MELEILKAYKNDPYYSLPKVRSVIPRKYYKPDWFWALGYSFVGISFFLLSNFFSYWVWLRGFWWIAPLAWILCGTAFGSLFALGHDCGHFSFYPAKWANIIFGHFFMLPSLYPYYAWKYMHDAHHKHTNLLENRYQKEKSVYFDTAWFPKTKFEYEDELIKTPWKAWAYRIYRIFLPLFVLLHFPLYIFNPFVFHPKHRKKVYLSYAIFFSLVFFMSSLLISLTGSFLSLFHFWILPSAISSCWMVLYTFLHHTSTETGFYEQKEWSPYLAQIRSTINCLFPRWLSFLHFNIDIHIPHHLAINIPCYYLRTVNQILKKSSYGKDIQEVPFSLNYLVHQVGQCNLWDPYDKNFEKFPKGNIFIYFTKKSKVLIDKIPLKNFLNI